MATKKCKTIEKPSSPSLPSRCGGKALKSEIPSSRRKIAAMADELSWMLASAVVKVARDKLVTALRLGGAAAASMPDENLRRHMEELKQRMEAMAEAVGDVEWRSIREKAARQWLIRLEEAAYGIWDMVDELQANNWKLVTEVHRPCLPIATARKGRSMVTRMQRAIENLDELLQHQHGLESCLAFRRHANKGRMEQSAGDAYPITPSFADTDNNEDYIVGRDLDKYHIIKRIILSAERNISTGLFIVSILGMPGIGKTTLAKMIFSDAATLTSDYARAWVTVGQEFDLKTIGNCILSQLSNKGEHQDSSDVELVMKRLDELLLGNNKLLVILDDLWSDDSSDLEGLRCMLGAAKEDSKVIVMVATHKESVARGLRADIYKMLPLSDVNSRHLLNRKLGFATIPDNDARGELVEDLLRKCGGVPLVIHAIGSTLRSKTPQEIRSVLFSKKKLNSDIRNWEEEEEKDRVFPALLASYQLMPPNLRLCFAYCAIFPRGHNILKYDLIHHWTALQLIEPSDGLSTTQLATRFIGKLLDMSFLQRTMHTSVRFY